MQPLAYDPRPLDVLLADGLLVPAAYTGPGVADPPASASGGPAHGSLRVRIGTGPSPGTDRPSGVTTTSGPLAGDAEVHYLHVGRRP